MQQRWWLVSLDLVLIACGTEMGPRGAELAELEAQPDAGTTDTDGEDATAGVVDASLGDTPLQRDAARSSTQEPSSDGVTPDDSASGGAGSGGATTDDPISTDGGEVPVAEGLSDGGPDPLVGDSPSESDTAAPGELPDSCFVAPPGVDEFPQAAGGLELQLGARDPTTGVDWLPLGRDCAIPIGGIGQAGLTARLAVRVRAPDGPVPRAKLRVTLVNYLDTERDPAPSNGQEVVQTLECHEDGWCYQVPLLVEISHLARLPELEGTLVTFDASAEQEDTGLTGRQLGWGMFVLDASESQSSSGTNGE